MRIDILLTRVKHLHDRIISLRREVWAHKTSLISPLFIELPVTNQESAPSCNLCVNGIDFASSYYFSIGFWKCSDSVVFFSLHFMKVYNIYVVNM